MVASKTPPPPTHPPLPPGLRAERQAHGCERPPWRRGLLAGLLTLVGCGGGSTGPAEHAAGSPAVPGAAATGMAGAATNSPDQAPPATAATPAAAASATDTAPAQPGVGPATLALLIADGDPDSEQAARLYQQARGIPDSHLIRVAVDTRFDAISDTAFQALKTRLDGQLGNDVQALLVTWQRPSRVAGSCAMSITSALAFGYGTQWCGGCNRTSSSAYYGSSSKLPWTDLRLRPAMMLGTGDLQAAQALVARGVAADGSMLAPSTTPQGWLVRTTDPARSVRHPDMAALAASPVSGVALHYVNNANGAAQDTVTAQADVMFYFTGLTRVAGIDSNRYLPGAVADHLTSFGGVLPTANGQMPATDWLQAGLTGSYGSVEEPCNYTEKFPSVSRLVRAYLDGATLIEAYWQSVKWPGQGLFIGDPLAKPWGRH